MEKRNCGYVRVSAKDENKGRKTLGMRERRLPEPRLRRDNPTAAHDNH